MAMINTKTDRFKKSKYKERIRITKQQLNWIKKNKDTRTQAGFLDKIINEYKYEKSKIRQMRKQDNAFSENEQKGYKKKSDIS